MPKTGRRHQPQPAGLFTAILRGKGAVAQALQQAIALGTRSVYIGGENSGIVNTGFLLTINFYLGSVKARSNKCQLARDLHAYLEWLQCYCNEAGLLFESERVGERATQAVEQIKLEHIFVPFDILECSANEPHPAPCGRLLALAGNRNALLVTEAGRGKTITLLNLARQLCWHLLLKRGWEDDEDLRKTLGLNSYRDLAVPFYVPLNVFAEELRDKGWGLKEFLDRTVPRNSFHLPLDFFSTLIDSDKPIVLLLDGFDEILDEKLRERVAEHLHNLMLGKQHVRFIISSRPSALYADRDNRDIAALRHDMARFAMAPFDRPALEKLIRAIYHAIDLPMSYKLSDNLLADIRRLEGERQRPAVADDQRGDSWAEECRQASGENRRLSDRLIDSPLMAALAVQVREYTGQPLPSRRVEFLGKAVEAALNAHYARAADERERLRQAVGGWANHGRLLSILALDRLEKGARDLTEVTLRRILKQANADAAHVDALRQFADIRGGLLRRQSDGRYWFIHLAIQQWLAAWRLIEKDAPADELAAFFVKGGRIAEETWREVALLAAGLRREGGEKFLDRNFGDNERLAGFLAALAARENDPALPPDVRFACAEVAVRAASDDLPDAHAIHARLTTPAANALERDATQARAALDTRLHLGAYLSRHGDPRAHVMQVDAMQFCLVPRGEFWMGEDESEFAEEQPAHRFDIPYDYWLGRYPVTNAQFDAFIQDEGYANPAWWTVARKAGAWRDGQVIRRVYRFDPNTLPPDMRTEFETLFAEERYAEAFSIIVKRKLNTLEEEAAASPGPALFHGAWLEFAELAQRFPNHPVTAVSWYEALAFCAWLEARWRTRGWLPEGWRITLPSEAEWEKAARGGERILARPVIAAPRELRDSGDGQPAQLATNPNPRRRYPWGDDFSTEACNVFETGEHFSTTVGCFAPHASPYGCQDMDGNVWEWTRSLYGRYDYNECRATCQFRYPYAEQIEVREDEAASPDITRALRGGSFGSYHWLARAAWRDGDLPDLRGDGYGFRVAARSHLSASGR